MNSSTTQCSSSVTRLCFIEEDDGLASLAQTEAEFPTNNNNKPLIYRPLSYNGFQRRSSSFINLASVLANGRFFHEDQLQHPTTHFLDSCFLCNKTLGDRDIFMYRGNIPFCSEECRQEQIEMDEVIEKSWNSTKALRKKEQTSSSPTKTNQNYRFRTSTVAAA